MSGATPESFMAWMHPFAQYTWRQCRLPVAGIIALAALETGWGQNIARAGEIDSRNLFNMKGVGPAGFVRVEAPEWYTMNEWTRLRQRGVSFRLTGRRRGNKWEGLVASVFRAYFTYEESCLDLCRLFTTNPRYIPVLEARDPFAFCSQLYACGYATDPAYVEKLHTILRRRVLPFLNRTAPGTAHK